MAPPVVLMTPIHVDALVLPRDTPFLDSGADFTRLPYFDGTRDVNSDTGYLSEAILAGPFANRELRLPAGVHLHWALPDALTRARTTDDGPTFPVVPNRWLVLRSRVGAAEPYEKAWVVHSDYLHPPGVGAATGSTAFPVDGTPPFRYLGRVVAFGDDMGEPEGAARLSGLTAVGPGDPLFAAFYPSCRNVFGLHDADIVVASAGLRYDVLGWYSDLAEDYLREVLGAADDPREALRRVAGWSVPADAGPAIAERMVCYARLDVTDPASGGSVEPVDTSVSVAVGNTGTQALGAYLADALRQSPAATVEDQLAAVLLAPRLAGADIAVSFAETVHESGFTAVPAGSTWTVRRLDGTGSPADAVRSQQQNTVAAVLAGQPSVDLVNHALNRLNLAQHDYDRASAANDSLREQLFADWYRYLLCAYPPAGTGEDYPDIDEVRHFIERRGLGDLAGRARSTGTLELRQDESGDVVPVAVGSGPDSAAAMVERAAADVRAALGALNASPAFAEANLVYRMQRVEAPRFWEPNEPAVLLAGAAMSPTLRHGQDGRLRADGLLDCQPATLPVPPATREDAVAVVRLLDRLAVGGIGRQVWDARAWDPLALDWEVEVLPAYAAPATTYPPDALVTAYELADGEPELRWRSGRGEVRADGLFYTGTSILTPHAQDLHIRRLAGYVMDIYQREHDLPALSDQEAAGHLAEPDNLLRVTRWQQAKPAPAGGAPDPVGTALLALAHLRVTPSLSQSLGGFNAGLLGRRQTLQLAVADPLGFDDYRRFADAVAALVGGHNRSAPAPGNAFSPLRSGALRLRRLRLLDTFGRTIEPRWTRVVAARQLPVTGDGDLVTVPPRFVQPARLSFRWLSADVGDQQFSDLAGETPICGWVLANHLDESLAFHSADGAALGALDRDGRWRFAPGVAPVTLEQIPDPHLRALVGYLYGRGGPFLRALHGAVDTALENVDPPGPAGRGDVALLVARPLAIVRAALDLELLGLPAVSQSWADLRADLRRDARHHGGVAEVRVPVRIGDYRRLGDGLVGFWRERDVGFDDIFHAPLGVDVTDRSIRTHADGEAAFELSLSGEPELLTMLVDPRGAVHATCGVLPVKSIDLPAEQYAEALRRIEVTFLAGPVLTPTPVLDVPLPAEPGYTWSWLEQTGTGWRETWQWPAIDRTEFHAGLAAALWSRLLDRDVRWLIPVGAAATEATVVPPAGRPAGVAPFPAALATVLGGILTQRQRADGTVALADFAGAVVPAVAAPAWDLLTGPDVGWLTPLDPGGTARVNAPGPDAAKLPAPLTGLEPLILSTLDTARRGIGRSGTGTPSAGSLAIREGWLKLSRQE